jgi:hypothetical protein
MRESRDDLLVEYYASHRAYAIINYNEISKNITQGRDIGRVFAEYKDKLVVMNGQNKKERVYLIPKTKVHRYGDMRVYLNMSENSLKEFKI